MRTKNLTCAVPSSGIWMGEPCAPLTMVIVANMDDEPDLAIIAPALVEAVHDELSVCFFSRAAPNTWVAIAGEPYDGPLRFVSLLGAVLVARRALARAAPPKAHQEAAMRVSLACIRSALDNAIVCGTPTELRAWIQLAQSEERRLARLVELAGAYDGHSRQ